MWRKRFSMRTVGTPSASRLRPAIEDRSAKIRAGSIVGAPTRKGVHAVPTMENVAVSADYAVDGRILARSQSIQVRIAVAGIQRHFLAGVFVIHDDLIGAVILV